MSLIVHTEYVDDVLPLTDIAEGCAWCQTTTSLEHRTAGGQAICLDCRSMAEELEHGPLIVDQFTYGGSDYTITPPLVLRLAVQYNDNGDRWLEGIADPAHPLTPYLWDGGHTGCVSESGGGIQDLRDAVTENLAECWESARDALADPGLVDFPQPEMRRDIATMEQHISPRPAW